MIEASIGIIKPRKQALIVDSVDGSGDNLIASSVNNISYDI